MFMIFMRNVNYFPKQIFCLKPIGHYSPMKTALFKSHVSFVGRRDFRGLTAGLANLALSRTFTVGSICLTKNSQVFHLRGNLSLLATTQHTISVPERFLFLYATVRLNPDVVPFLEPAQSTPYAVSIYNHCTHTHVMRCSVHLCNANVSLHYIPCPCKRTST